MRIAVYHNLPSGGGKRALYEQVSRLGLRHDIDVYTLSCSEHEFCDLRPHCRNYYVADFIPAPLLHSPFGRLNQGIRAWDLLRLRESQKEMARQIDRGHYDVAFVANCQFGASPSLMQYLSIPSVYYCGEPPRLAYEPPIRRPYGEHTMLQSLLSAVDPLPSAYHRTLRGLDAANVRAASAILVNSSYSRERLYHTYGVFARVAYLGVDAAHFRPLGIATEDYVLSVGAINAAKGFDLILRSLALLSPDQRPRLVVVANSSFRPEQDHLEATAAQLGVDMEIRVRVSDEDLLEIYNHALLMLYAPIMEPFGLVALEASACGLPVVGVREAGLRESVLDGQTGVLTERDPLEFAQAVAALLEDKDRRDLLGSQGRAYAESCWSWEKSVERVESLLARWAR